MLSIIKKFNLKEWEIVLFSILFIILQVYLDLEIPSYMTKITAALETKGTEAIDILIPGLKMILLSIMSMLSSIMVGFLAAKVAAGFSARLRNNVFTKIMNYSTTDINRFSVPSLLTRSTNDITQIQLFIAMGMQVIVKAPITALWALSKIANKGWQWTTATGIAVLVLIGLLTLILTLVQPRFKIVQTITDRLNLITRENLSGIRVVHAYGAENYQIKKFDEANQHLTRTNRFANQILALMNPGMSLISSLLTLAVYAIGAIMINSATSHIKLTLFSNMIVFSSYAMQVIIGFMLLSIIFIILPRVTVSSARIDEVLNVTPSVKYPNDSPSKFDIKGSISFDSVSFRFKDAQEDAVSNVTFNINSGETVALIGATGSGKTTILNLIARQYNATKGTVTVDGFNVNSYQETDLNNKIGYIPQKSVLFSGTIRSNIDFGNSTNKNSPLSDEEIIKSLEIAQATNLLNEKLGGIDAEVTQKGDNLSGGQKQRLAIARAIARKSEILMFDDSFSALDYATDKMIRQKLQTEVADTTKIIVAQRISTIMNADKIIVLDKGKIVGIGTHKQLLSDNKVYQEIAYSQLSKEELN